ncbi:phage holin family protein [Candidatus Uhrbacteria bacterium]|nr:phage holin family protein [Candidatus Uhrbacteria bacterium]
MLLLLRLFLNALAVLAVTYLIPGVMVKDFPHAFLAAIVLGLVNALIRPILELLTLPITILTLGLFTLIINALMFWLASSFVPGFTVQGFGAAFWGGLVFWIISWLTNSLLKKESSHE